MAENEEFRHVVEKNRGELFAIYLIVRKLVESMVVNGFLASEDVMDQIDSCMLIAEERKVTKLFSSETKGAAMIFLRELYCSLDKEFKHIDTQFD